MVKVAGTESEKPNSRNFKNVDEDKTDMRLPPKPKCTGSEYHLQVIDYDRPDLAENPARRSRYQSRVDEIIEDLFLIGETDLPDDYNCPLVYSSHVIETIACDSEIPKKILKLAFKLSTTACASITLPQALTEFCNKAFSKEGQAHLIKLSKAKIFGLSPIPESGLVQIWNSAFFLRTIQNQGTNLRWLIESHSDSYEVPGWLSTACFVFSATPSFNYGIWAARTLTEFVGYDAIVKLSLQPAAITAAKLTAAGFVVCETSRAFLEIRAVCISDEI